MRIQKQRDILEGDRSEREIDKVQVGGGRERESSERRDILESERGICTRKKSERKFRREKGKDHREGVRYVGRREITEKEN